MKKVILFCLIMATGLLSHAQIIVHWNSPGASALPTGTTSTGGVSGGTGWYTISGTYCVSDVWGAHVTGSTGTNGTVTVLYTSPSGIVSNGEAINCAFNWGAISFNQNANNVRCTVQAAYAVGTTGGTFTNIGTPVTITQATNCTDYIGTIPAGTIPAGQGFRFRITVTGTTGNPSPNVLFMIQSIDLAQTVTAPPACTTVTQSLAKPQTPNTDVRSTFSWPIASGAASYELKVGTSAGASDVLDINTTDLSYTPPSDMPLPANTTLYASVTAKNDLGNTPGCSEIQFTTTNNTFAPYCGPLVQSAGNPNGPAWSLDGVTLNGVTYTNTTESGAQSGTISRHLNNTDKIFDVEAGQTYPMTMVAEGISPPGATDIFGFSAFVDWNQDHVFDPDTEGYFITAGNLLNGTGATITKTGNLVVPANAKAGLTRMRVRYNYTGSATVLHNGIVLPCGDIINGQVHDYTIRVKPTCTTLANPANGSTITPTGTTTPVLLVWDAVEGADGYKVYIGTTSGGTDIMNGDSFTNSFTTVQLGDNKTYYIKIVPYVGTVEASACNEGSFSISEYLAVSEAGKNNVSAYPNPFTDVLNISDVKDVKSISVSDISVCFVVRNMKPTAALNLSSLKSGLYIVNLHMNDGTVKSIKAMKK